ALLHLAHDVRDHLAVGDRKLELDTCARAADLDLEMASRPPDARALHRLGGLDDDVRQRRVGDAHVGRENPHAPASAGSVAPASSMNDVEYSPLRNSSLPRISTAASHVVGTTRTSSSRSARRARSMHAARDSSCTMTFAISES